MKSKVINFKVIDLEWEEAFLIKYNRDEDKYDLSLGDNTLLDQNGLYQIYGRHPIYGDGVLLYIGETKESSTGRCFKDRLNEHLRGSFWFHTELSVRLAPCELDSNEIKLVEAMLIAANKPALNKNSINKPDKSCNAILVQNWGFLGSLQAITSGDYLLPAE